MRPNLNIVFVQEILQGMSDNPGDRRYWNAINAEWEHREFYIYQPGMDNVKLFALRIWQASIQPNAHNTPDICRNAEICAEFYRRYDALVEIERRLQRPQQPAVVPRPVSPPRAAVHIPQPIRTVEYTGLGVDEFERLASNGDIVAALNAELDQARNAEECFEILNRQLLSIQQPYDEFPVDLHLDLSRKGLIDPDISELIRILTQYDCVRLLSLKVSGNNIQCLDIQNINAFENLTNLDIRGNDIKAGGARIIAANFRNLTILDISLNQIGVDGIQAIAENLRNLITLEVASSRIGGVEGARAIAAHFEHLATLNITGNNIGVEGVRAIANLRNLATLHISSNHLDAAAAQVLGDNPNLRRNLTSLTIDDNPIGVEGARAIANLTNLRTLSIFNNGIGMAGAQAIAANLINLRILNISENNIGPFGARAIAAHLGNLIELAIYHNRIGTEGAQAIARLRNLEILFIGYNRIGTAGAQAIAVSLRNLKTLYINLNEIDDATVLNPLRQQGTIIYL